MLFFRIITIALTFDAAMAERVYNVVTTTTAPSCVDSYHESLTTSLFLYKQQSVSNPGSCSILCTKDKYQPCEGFTLKIEQDTGRFTCKLGKGLTK